MSRKVLYSRAAIGDLDGIAEWVAGETGDADGARRVVRRIVERVGLLGDFPEMGRELPETIGAGIGYRHLVAGAWRVFYRVGEDAVWVDRVLHSRRNHMVALFGEDAGDGVGVSEGA